MIDPLFAIVCFVSSGSTVPDWVVTGPDAEIGEIEYRLEELMYDAWHHREALADGNAQIRFKVPAEVPYRTFALLLDELERREVTYIRPSPVPGFCPHGGAEQWHDRVESSENPNTPGPIVGVFGTDAQLARFRETPEWGYRPAELVDGRVGLTFSPTWAEIENYSEYLSQVRAEFGAIDIVLMEPVDEALSDSTSSAVSPASIVEPES